MDATRQPMLVGYDGSPPARRALEHAADLAGRGATVSVINVISVQSVSSRLETVSDEARARQDRLLLEGESVLGRHGVNANLIRAAGVPATEILSAATSIGAPVIVVGRSSRSAPHLLHAPLSTILARRAPTDVLVVH